MRDRGLRRPARRQRVGPRPGRGRLAEPDRCSAPNSPSACSTPAPASSSTARRRWRDASGPYVGNERRGRDERASGVVYLVGAGPGDPGLMTARSLELIASADAIFHDRLIPPGALDGAREDAELVYVGKAPGKPVGPAGGDRRAADRGGAGGQERRAAEGRRPVRLRPRRRGGRGAARGRGRVRGRARGHRRRRRHRLRRASRSPTATTPPRSPSSPATRTPRRRRRALDWEALARFPGTLVFYMGVKRLADNAAALIAAGRDADEPAAAVERGTMDGQRTVVATLGTLAEAVEREGIGAPALIVVGPVVGAPRVARLARAAAPARPPRRRHPRPRPGQRPRRDAARRSAPRWSSCRRSGSSRGSRARRCGARSSGSATTR